jgi:predicted metal-binding protein
MMELLEEVDRARKLLDFALECEGVCRAKLIHTRNIVVDERVRFQCGHSGCREYGRRLMCPPYNPGVEEFRRVLSGYFMAMLLQVEGSITGENWEPETDALALKLHDAVYRLEKKAFSLGFPFAAGFIGGPCKLCGECPGVRNPQTGCISREKARPSMEGMGIDVIATCKNAGMDIEFSPGKVVWTGMLLLS